jgi:hypothetical protein
MDRNAQFEYINKKAGSFLTDRQPVILVDTNYARVGIMHGFRWQEGEQQMPAPFSDAQLATVNLFTHYFHGE